MPGTVILRKTGNNYIGLKFSYYPNHIGQHFVVVPFTKSFICCFAIPKIVSTGKKLFGTIHPAGRHQFVGAYKPKFNPLFVANQVLPTITPCKAQVGGA
jgi:hypothetical protein